MRLDQPGNHFEVARKQEWLETNGLGGFAGSTVLSMNTRRYHGLLIAALRPPVERKVLLSKLEEKLRLDGEIYQLSTNQYPGAVYPQGHLYLKTFRLDPFPVFVYELSGVQLEKRVFMLHGENTTVIEYKLTGDTGSRSPVLEVRPLIAFRDYHSLAHKNDALNSRVALAEGYATITPYTDLPALHFANNADQLELDGGWYYNFEYVMEQARGLDFHEDLFNPFCLKFHLSADNDARIIASLLPHSVDEVPRLRENEIERRQQISAVSPVKDEFVRDLVTAADQFLVKRGDLETIVAGYHWFTDWGRDTMIALPGLTLVTLRFQAAKNILSAFARATNQGMLPNRFPDAGETPEYNTVDATLWLFESIASLLRYTGDDEFVRRQLFSTLVSIFDWHMRGTRFGIHVNEFGLLEAGEPGTQLTWMDAKIGDYVVTPRIGAPVEIQALWYNALRILSELALRYNAPDLSARASHIAERAQKNFNEMFWNESAGCLFDVVKGDQRDDAIRPNQIFAGSLTFPIVSQERMQKILKVVERELLTPRGLRSLARGDKNYRPVYQGDQWQRDTAYHQGTVWCWLLGPFVTAYVRAHGNSRKSRAQAREWMSAMREHLSEACLGQVSEIFDAEPPHEPYGCVAQAWSVAELLRATVEDIDGIRPPFEQNALAKAPFVAAST